MIKHELVGYDEVNDVCTLNFNGCSPVTPDGIGIVISEAWDDSTPRRHIILTCHGGLSGLQYRMDADRAESLGLLILSAAKAMKEMSAKMDADAEREGASP